MFDLNNLIIFLLATLTLNFTPGPDMLYVITRSVGQGRAAGVASSFGITAGCMIHMLAVAFGLAGLLMTAPLLYNAVKYAGAAYLIYLGLRTLLSRQKLQAEEKLRQDRLSAVFLQGMLTNVLNPKVALFFLAFLPQFIDLKAGSHAIQVVLLGSLFNLSGTVVNLFVALTASSIGGRFKVFATGSALTRWLPGSVFIGLGLRLALAQRGSNPG